MEEQYLQQDSAFDNTFGKLINKYLPQIEKVKIQQKHNVQQNYQYQELCKKLYPIYGQKIFTLPYRTFYSDYKLEMAHKKTEQFCKDKIPENRFKYMVACMRKMPY